MHLLQRLEGILLQATQLNEKLKMSAEENTSLRRRY